MSGAGPRRARPLVLVGIGLFATCSALLVLALVVRFAQSALPSGRRASIEPTASSDEQPDVGRYWYTEPEAQALSAELATAVEGTDWCLGWAIIIDEPGTGIPGDPDVAGDGDERADVGSSRGPDVSARTCRRWVEIEVVYLYTSSSSEQEDNAAFGVWTPDPAVSEAFEGHPSYQVSSSDLLREDRGDTRDDVIGNAIAGMPLVLAEAGALDPLAVEPVPEGTDGAVAFADREGEGGSDLWRSQATWLLASGLAVAAGLTLLLMAWARVPAYFFGGGAVTATGPDGRPVNPRRALKAALARARTEEEPVGPGPSDG